MPVPFEIVGKYSRIVDYLSKNPCATTRDISKALDVDCRTMYDLLDHLMIHGYIERKFECKSRGRNPRCMVYKYYTKPGLKTYTKKDKISGE